MKQWLLVFAAGLVAGIALGVVAADWAGPGTAENEGSGIIGNAGTGSHGGAPGAASNQESKSSPRIRVRRSNRGKALLSYLDSLSGADELHDVNLLEFIRYSNAITMFSEAEARAAVERIEEAERSEEEDNEMRQVALALVMARWAELDGPGALAYLTENEAGSSWEGDTDDLATFAVTSWVESDPAGAAAWFRRNVGAAGDEHFRKLFAHGDVQESFFASMVRTEAGLGRELAVEFGDRMDLDAMEAVARHERTEEGLRQLLDSIREDDGRSRLAIVRQWSKRNAPAAAAWLGEHSHEDSQLAFTVGRAYVDQDPETGAAWLMSRETPGQGVEARMKTVVQQWARSDPAAAGEWLGRQPDDAARNAAEAQLASLLAYRSQWEDAFRWAAAVDDSEERLSAVTGILKRGRSADDRLLLTEKAAAAGLEPELQAWRQAQETGGDR